MISTVVDGHFFADFKLLVARLPRDSMLEAIWRF